MKDEANKVTEPLEPKIFTRFGTPCELVARSTAWDRVFVKCTYEDGTFMHRWVYPHDLRSDGGAKAIFEIIKTLPLKEIDRVK